MEYYIQTFLSLCLLLSILGSVVLLVYLFSYALLARARANQIEKGEKK